MAPNPRRIDERLERLYGELPKLECAGHCSDCCGPIDMSLRERERMERAAGHPIGCNGITCNMLAEGRCSVYSLRPMICRLWGLVPSMRCHYGCRPEGGLLSDAEGATFLARAMEIGGAVTSSDEAIAVALRELREGLSREEFRRAIEQAFALAKVQPARLDKRSQRTIFHREGAT